VKKSKYFNCKVCDCQTSQGNSFHKLCLKCNQSRLIHKAKSRVKKKPKVYRKKPTGERDMFIEIWDSRPHICTNCGDPLGNEPKVHFFSHIKPKGKYPELRLKKSNIKILCIECHRNLDFGGL
jgi:5-methylcytosine-specific restriction endonuclease McrA